MKNLSDYNFGIITAMDSEFEILRANLEDENKEQVFDITYYFGKIYGHNVVIAKAGIGKVNAASATSILIDHFECNIIINSGIAGGIKPVKTKDLVIANALVYNDVDATIFGYAYGQVPQMPKKYITNPNIIILLKRIIQKLNLNYHEGIIASGDKFADNMDVIKYNEPGILAVDMESTAVAQIATKAGIDFLIIRFISDVIGEASQIELYNEFEDEMANESAKITLNLFEALK